MKIIPAIDIIDGKCVRLEMGDYETKKIYNEDPLEIAKQFEANGIKYLHLVDLDAAKKKKISNLAVLEKLAKDTNLQIDFGGGIQSKADVELILNAGAKQVTLGSLAVKAPAVCIEIIEHFGGEKIILGADCIGRKIAINAWQDMAELDVIDFINDYFKKGFYYSVVTDVAKDGMLQGPSLALYKEILENTSIKLIASGGVSCMEDVAQLKAIGCIGVIVGKAIYENKITLKELSVLC